MLLYVCLCTTCLWMLCLPFKSIMTKFIKLTSFYFYFYLLNNLIGATAWFWVVFLTTVGYGNQSPTTFDGRLFVGSIGWFLIIVWAIILYVSGSVLGIIVDDFLRRLHLRKFTGDKLGVFVWGFFALGWMAMIGTFAFYWFNYATHPGEWDIHDFWKNDNEVNELYMHIGASYWFAYISLLTVGTLVCHETYIFSVSLLLFWLFKNA